SLPIEFARPRKAIVDRFGIRITVAIVGIGSALRLFARGEFRDFAAIKGQAMTISIGNPLSRFDLVYPQVAELGLLDVARAVRGHLAIVRGTIAFRHPPRWMCFVISSDCGDNLINRLDDKIGVIVVAWVGDHNIHTILWAARAAS